MTKELDPARLKQIRDRRALSQEELAGKAGLNKQTVYRLERGGRPTRLGTLARLSQALDVEADVLTGEKPIPALGDQPGKPVDDEKFQLRFRFDGATRNAYSLAKLRYNVSLRNIAELAPFLFVVVAEMSLQRRRARLEQFESALKEAGALVKNFPHLQMNKFEITESEDEAVSAEQASIAARDIFAESLPGTICPDWEPNPFFHLLQELTTSIGDVAKMESASSYFADYAVCPDEALALAGGDKTIAAELQSGQVLIHDIPRDLMPGGRTAERMDWLRTKIAENEAKRPTLSLEAFEDFQLQDSQDEVLL